MTRSWESNTMFPAVIWEVGSALISASCSCVGWRSFIQSISSLSALHSFNLLFDHCLVAKVSCHDQIKGNHRQELYAVCGGRHIPADAWVNTCHSCLHYSIIILPGAAQWVCEIGFISRPEIVGALLHSSTDIVQYTHGNVNKSKRKGVANDLISQEYT